MWIYDSYKNEYTIQIIQLISGVSKEFLLELSLPPIFQNLKDYERNSVLLNAEITLFANLDKDRKNPITKKSELELTFYNEDEKIPEEAINFNDNVELNYMRVRGAETI